MWQVAGWQASARAVQQVAAALARGDPNPQPGDAELVEHVLVASKPVFPVSHVGPVHWAAREGGRPKQDPPRVGGASQ